MSTAQIGRRHVLRGAGLLAGGAAVAMIQASPVAAADNDRPHTITGGWKLHRSDPTGEYDGITTFATGGTASYLDINPVAPRPLIGVWSEAGRDFRYDFWTGFEADPTTNSPASTAEVVGQGTRSGSKLSSTYTVTFYDAVTKAVLLTYDGTFSATSFHV